MTQKQMKHAALSQPEKRAGLLHELPDYLHIFAHQSIGRKNK
jgi:hypothetical protein